MRNLPLTFDCSTYSQKLEEDFETFCGLLRIYELYLDISGNAAAAAANTATSAAPCGPVAGDSSDDRST